MKQRIHFLFSFFLKRIIQSSTKLFVQIESPNYFLVLGRQANVIQMILNRKRLKKKDGKDDQYVKKYEKYLNEYP